MSNEVIGVLIGGVAPAIILGFFCITQKLATRHGAGPGEFLMLLGGISVIIGAVLLGLKGEFEVPVAGSLWSILSAMCWGVSMGGVAYSLFKYHIPISKLNPIFNTNTLTSVLIGIIFLGEWAQVNVWQVLTGAVLIICGALVVSRA